jgi:[ribosomal protein S5]-alanine N-acetyltransferase
VTELADGSVRLRPFTERDVPAVASACRDPEIARWIPVPVPYTDSDARAYVDSARDTRAIVDARTGELLGSIGWRIVDQGNFQIGYWVKTEARGRGAATRALRLLSRWALDELGLPRAQLLAEPANRASQRVAEKVGFRRECVLRSYLDVRGERRDGVMFALLRGEL